MTHDHYMRQALAEAEQALVENEVPVGAVIVHGERVIAAATTSGRCCTTRPPTPR
ncbi:MAG TPA: deaminase [Pirellulaceae bacterium]|nr:deaminase [Pirellulaceae bacterium]